MIYSIIYQTLDNYCIKNNYLLFLAQERIDKRMPRPQDPHSYSYQLILEQREIFALTKTLQRLTAEIKADTQRLRQKYDPSQPRVPKTSTLAAHASVKSATTQRCDAANATPRRP